MKYDIEAWLDGRRVAVRHIKADDAEDAIREFKALFDRKVRITDIREQAEAW